MVRHTGDILSILKNNKAFSQKKYPISEPGIFGSYARGEQRPESDIDVLVDFDGQIGGFIKLAHDLEDLLGAKIASFNKWVNLSHFPISL